MLDALNKNFNAIFAPQATGPKLNISDKDDFWVYGITGEYLDIFEVELLTGRSICPVDVINNANVILINQDMKNAITGYADPIGQYINYSGYKFEIIGIIDSRVALIPATTLVHKIAGNSSIKTIYVKVPDYGKIETVISDTEAFLNRFSNSTDMFRFFIPSEGTERLYSLEKSLNRFIIIVSILLLFVGGIGIMNIMLSSQKERIREIGIKKAVGARNIYIFMQFLIETLLIFLVGGLVGIVLGIAGVNINIRVPDRKLYLGENRSPVFFQSIFITGTGHHHDRHYIRIISGIQGIRNNTDNGFAV